MVAERRLLVRFVQMHESFRQAEIDALAELNNLEIEWVSYLDDSPFAIIRLLNCADVFAAAKALVSRSILAMGIYELWAQGADYAALHDDVRAQTAHLWPQYRQPSFRFELDSFHGSRSQSEQRAIIETFSYMGFEGPIVMNNPDEHFTIFEDFRLNAKAPHRLLLGRLLAKSGRRAIATYNLKKRRYIATTSMDAELSLVTANMAHAAPGRLVYDPFMGTGSFPLACAHFGACVFGSDMDGRSIRGKKDRTVAANFAQYGTSAQYLGGFAADVTNTPVRRARVLDAVVCDPPYGVREGLKVLGSLKPALQHEVRLADGRPAHLAEAYVPPRKPYSFVRMIDDILEFGADMLVDGGRLCMWMPVAGNVVEDTTGDVEGAEGTKEEVEEEAEYALPEHPALELASVCTQDFNKWSRRLLTYRRRKDEQVDQARLEAHQAERRALQASAADGEKMSADELNSFRKKYFEGFKAK